MAVGRPRGTQMTHKLFIRLTPSQHRMLEHAADLHGLTCADAVRLAIAHFAVDTALTR